jgi:predicted PolB exonuclease-like 3'-5' exonuclease
MNQGHEGDYFFAFDIETVPDVEAGRRLHGLEGLDDPSVAKAMHHLRMQESGREFVRPYLQQVVAVSGVLRRRAQSGENADIRIWSLGAPESSEKELVESFFRIVDLRAPTLITWNGIGFDLPILVYRALHHGVSTGRYFETRDPDFRFNNYLNRYHERHTDLMDVFSGHQLRSAAPLEELSRFLGLPGKQGMRGADVEGRYFAGEIDAIRNYCEGDALLIWLIHLRFDRLRGRLDDAQLAHELALVREAVRDRDHLQAFADVGEPE